MRKVNRLIFFGVFEFGVSIIAIAASGDSRQSCESHFLKNNLSQVKAVSEADLNHPPIFQVESGNYRVQFQPVARQAFDVIDTVSAQIVAHRSGQKLFSALVIRSGPIPRQFDFHFNSPEHWSAQILPDGKLSVSILSSLKDWDPFTRYFSQPVSGKSSVIIVPIEGAVTVSSTGISGVFAVGTADGRIVLVNKRGRSKELPLTELLPATRKIQKELITLSRYMPPLTADSITGIEFLKKQPDEASGESVWGALSSNEYTNDPDNPSSLSAIFVLRNDRSRTRMIIRDDQFDDILRFSRE